MGSSNSFTLFYFIVQHVFQAIKAKVQVWIPTTTLRSTVIQLSSIHTLTDSISLSTLHSYYHIMGYQNVQSALVVHFVAPPALALFVAVDTSTWWKKQWLVAPSILNHRNYIASKTELLGWKFGDDWFEQTIKQLVEIVCVSQLESCHVWGGLELSVL